jgi:hypothetical protein
MKNAETKTAEKSPKLPTRASALDTVVLNGGTWPEILTAADAAVVPLKTKVKRHDIAFIKTHIRYRTRQKPSYFAGIKVDENGITFKK